MVSEGEIDINGETKSTGFVFNQKGFFSKAISGDKVVTKSFVTVWAVSLSELEDIARTHVQVKVKYLITKQQIDSRISLNSQGYWLINYRFDWFKTIWKINIYFGVKVIHGIK